MVAYLAKLCYKFSTEYASEKIENWLIFGENMDKRLQLTFLGHPVCTSRMILPFTLISSAENNSIPQLARISASSMYTSEIRGPRV